MGALLRNPRGAPDATGVAAGGGTADETSACLDGDIDHSWARYHTIVASLNSVCPGSVSQIVFKHFPNIENSVHTFSKHYPNISATMFGKCLEHVWKLFVQQIMLIRRVRG